VVIISRAQETQNLGSQIQVFEKGQMLGLEAKLPVGSRGRAIHKTGCKPQKLCSLASVASSFARIFRFVHFGQGDCRGPGQRVGLVLGQRSRSQVTAEEAEASTSTLGHRTPAS